MATSAGWVSEELLGFDFETTGVDRFHDVPVSFALVRVVGGTVVERSCGLVDPGREIPAGATAVHGISSEHARRWGQPLADAITLVADAILDASVRGVPVVGMKLDYDLTMLDAQMHQLCGVGLGRLGWCGPVLDGLVLDRHFDRYRKGRRTLVDLCANYGVLMANAHDASADAEASVRIVRAMTLRFPRLGEMPCEVLHRRQIRWHREWAESFDEYRRDQGKPGLCRDDFVWPYVSSSGRARRWVA